MDILLSGIALILLLPIFFVIGILIKIDSTGPAFFIQNRAGKDGRIFKVCKFRTMEIDSDKDSKMLSKDDPKITRVGKYLRWGMDELPQLINVFKGDMSLVGPRPALEEQAIEYSERHRRRLGMKPGLTGWALVNGRNAISWAEKIEYDIWYIDNWSLFLDFQILIRTVLVVLKGEGIYGEDGVNVGYIKEKE